MESRTSMMTYACTDTYIHIETDKIAKMGRGEQAGAMLTVNFYH